MKYFDILPAGLVIHTVLKVILDQGSDIWHFMACHDFYLFANIL